MRQVYDIIADVVNAREDYNYAETLGDADDARSALHFLLEEYFDATVTDVAPTERLVRAAPPVMLS